MTIKVNQKCKSRKKYILKSCTIFQAQVSKNSETGRLKSPSGRFLISGGIRQLYSCTIPKSRRRLPDSVLARGRARSASCRVDRERREELTRSWEESGSGSWFELHFDDSCKQISAGPTLLTKWAKEELTLPAQCTCTNSTARSSCLHRQLRVCANPTEQDLSSLLCSHIKDNKEKHNQRGWVLRGWTRGHPASQTVQQPEVKNNLGYVHISESSKVCKVPIEYLRMRKRWNFFKLNGGPSGRKMLKVCIYVHSMYHQNPDGIGFLSKFDPFSYQPWGGGSDHHWRLIPR